MLVSVCVWRFSAEIQSMFRHAETRPALMRNVAVCTLKLTFGVLLVWWLFATGRFDPNAYATVFSPDRVFFLAGIVFGQAIMLLAPLVRWWLLVRAQGLPISLTTAIKLGLMGAFANLFVPGGLGIDGMRLVHMARWHRDRFIPGAASIFLDRALGVVALLALGTICGIVLLVETFNTWVLRLVLINAGLLATMMMVLGLAFGFFGSRPLALLRRFRLIDRAVRAAGIYRGRYRILASAVLLSLVAHCGVCVATCFALLSLGCSAPIAAVFAVTPVILISRTIPLTPLGLGVSDGLAAFLYPLVGLDGGAEVQMLLRAMIVFVFLTCGLAYLVPGKGCDTIEQTPAQLPEEAVIGL